MRVLRAFSLVCVLCALAQCTSSISLKQTHTISDHKEWKKTLKTRTNVLTLFTSSESAASGFVQTFEQVAERIRGKGTLVYVDCSSKDGKKLCKTLKIKPSTFEMKHYKDGKFNKDYDRLMNEKSLFSFMENPTADPPWSEDPTSSGVRHIEGPSDFERLIKKEKKPILTMFYAPWCGHCKRIKPEFATAAEELKGQAVLAGMDVDTPDAYGIRQEFNITGFPTIIYFEKGQRKFDFSGGRDKDGIVEWMRDPKAASEIEPQEEELPWSEIESDVAHLNTENFDSFLQEHPSVLVMFYAPWCGHCKAMKPHFTEAAEALKDQKIDGILAAVDATKEQEIANRYEVKGFPTIKYFQDGEMKFDYGFGRTTQDLIDFMTEPQEPPPPEKEWAETESEVHHLTDENFKSFLKKKKHVLVMFYTPWCGHCKAAKPEFTTAAEVFSEDKKTEFAAVDCTKYRSVCDQYDVTGFPTIKYFSFGKKEARYNGPRMEADFVLFMNDPSSHLRSEL